MADLLRNTADAGGRAVLRDERRAGSSARRSTSALEDVNTRAVTFGSASVSTLQASASQNVLVPRFSPSKGAAWDGHLFAFDLCSEFTGGCTRPAERRERSGERRLRLRRQVHERLPARKGSR